MGRSFSWVSQRGTGCNHPQIQHDDTIPAMPKLKIDRSILEAALRGFEHTGAEVTQKIAEIKRMLGGGASTGTETQGAPRRTISASARARMAAGQRKRWAAVKKQQG